MKTAITIIVIIIIVALGFFYATRAPSVPTVDVNTVTGTSTISNELITYRIAQASSTVEFRIGEILNDEPNQAIGVTNQVAGDIYISTSSINIGTIAVNARTFKTDSERRDGAIARFILKSENPAYEFIYFRPTTVTGAPSSISPGSEFNLTATGDLTVAGVTKPATFNIVMTINENSISGTATLPMKRSDYNLAIPSVRSVASVDENFVVVANIVAERQ